MAAGKRYGVADIVISAFEVEDLNDRSATVYFRVAIHGAEDSPRLVSCRLFFVREGDHWRVREARVFNPVVNQDQLIPLPI